MRNDLMQEPELKQRYKPSLANLLTIEKYQRLRLKKNWEELRLNKSDYLGVKTCALCTRHENAEWDCFGINGEDPCPLKPEGKTMGCHYGSLYNQICIAVSYHDRKNFLKLTKQLIDKVQRAEARP